MTNTIFGLATNVRTQYLGLASGASKTTSASAFKRLFKAQFESGLSRLVGGTTAQATRETITAPTGTVKTTSKTTQKLSSGSRTNEAAKSALPIPRPPIVEVAPKPAQTAYKGSLSTKTDTTTVQLLEALHTAIDFKKFNINLA